MTADKIVEKYTAHTRFWIDELGSFSQQFFVQSQEGEWSVAQVVDHLCKTTHKCLDMAELCCDGKGEKGHISLGPAIFSFMGSFPPIKLRIKNPPKEVKGIYTPENITIKMAEKSLREAELRMQRVLPKIKNADLTIRCKHWAGGWFNAFQWFQNSEMHIKHHIRQLERIKRNSVS